jgi:hypothetical protein
LYDGGGELKYDVFDILSEFFFVNATIYPQHKKKERKKETNKQTNLSQGNPHESIRFFIRKPAGQEKMQ